jgi:hypothetical protein
MADSSAFGVSQNRSSYLKNNTAEGVGYSKKGFIIQSEFLAAEI